MTARAFALLACGLAACTPAGAPVAKLAVNERHEDVLDLSRARSKDFEIDVDAHTVALRVELSSSGAELDLLVRAGLRVSEHDDADFHVPTDAGAAVIVVDRFSDPPIAPGKWFAHVTWTSERAPRTADRRLASLPFALRAETFAARTDGTLAANTFIAGRIVDESGGFRCYAIDVPPNASVLRVDVTDADQDLDLLAHAGAQSCAIDESTAYVQHFYGSETLVLSKDSEPPLVPGQWFVDVVDAQGAERPVAFRVRASFDAAPPAELLELPHLASSTEAHAAPLARALAAVVEITTDEGVGSGTIVSSDGWVLTNAHVVAGMSDTIHPEVVIALPLSLERPPVESFRGRVTHVDRERDLALVHIERGFYDQPIPPGYLFPSIDIDASDALTIGDPLWLLGYPSTGGQGSRVTIHCTRGIVSGFERADFGRVIKTDAEINSGNSGGAALDAAGRIVGVPTSVSELGSGQTGFVHPLSALPEAWRRTIATRAR